MAVDTIAMLLGLMFGFGHGGGLFSEDWPHHEYYIPMQDATSVSFWTWSFFIRDIFVLSVRWDTQGGVGLHVDTNVVFPKIMTLLLLEKT